MSSKEKLFHLLESLDEQDQKTAYQLVQSLVQPNEEAPKGQSEVKIFGKDYYIIRD